MDHQTHKVVPFIVTLACLIIILAGLKLASSIITPLLLAMFIAIICAPVIAFMMRHKIPQLFAVGVLLGIIFAIFTIFASFIANAVNEFNASLPQYRILLTEKIDMFANLMEKRHLTSILPQEKLIEIFDPNTAINFIRNLLSQVSGAISSIFILFLIVVFMLLEIPSIQKKLDYLVSDQQEYAQKQVKEDVYKVVNGIIQYLSIKTFTSLLTGILVYFTLSILDVQYAILWGVFTFLLNYIPNIGSIIAAIPPILQALLLNSLLDASLLAIAFIIINTVIGNFLEPKLMGKQLGLSTLIVFLSLIFWGWLLGPVGMFLSVPLTMATKIALGANEKTKKLAYLLGNE